MRGLVLALLFIAVHQALYNAVRPFVPLYIDEAGASAAVIGIVTAATALLPLVLAVPTGAFGDRHGIRGMLALGTAAATVALVLLAMSAHLAAVIAAQMLIGLSHMLVILGLQPYVSRLASGRRREKHIARYGVAAAIGLIAGPLLAGFLLAQVGFRGMFLIVGLIGLLPLAIIPLLPDIKVQVSPQERTPRGKHMFRSLRSPAVQVGLIVSASASIVDSVRVSFLPIYLDQAVMLSPAQVGAALSVFSVATLTARLALPWVMQHLGRWSVVVLVMASGGVAIAAMPAVGIVLAPMLIAFMGLAFGIGKSLSLMFVSEGSEDNERGLVMGLRLGANRTVDFGAPLLFGAVVSLFGLAACFASGAALIGGASVYLFGLQRRIARRA